MPITVPEDYASPIQDAIVAKISGLAIPRVKGVSAVFVQNDFDVEFPWLFVERLSDQQATATTDATQFWLVYSLMLADRLEGGSYPNAALMSAIRSAVKPVFDRQKPLASPYDRLRTWVEEDVLFGQLKNEEKTLYTKASVLRIKVYISVRRPS